MVKGPIASIWIAAKIEPAGKIEPQARSVKE